jgi:hypothetical protein
MPEPQSVFRGLLGFVATLVCSYLYYALCYKRKTTFLLTVSLVSFWVGLIWNGIFLLKGMEEIDFLFGCSLILGIFNYLFTRKLRHLNKALQGYAKFPKDSKEAVALMQSATSPKQLQNFFCEGIKKWPRLKWVLQRELKIRVNYIYCRRHETLILGSSETKANRSEALRTRRPFPDGKGDEEDRLDEVVASPKSKFHADGSIRGL